VIEMKKFLIVGLILISVLLLIGCKKGEVDSVSMTVETEEGEQTTTVTGDAGSDDWCPEGGNWQMTSTGVEGDTSATWKIDKLEDSGKYAGLCHVVYKAETPEGDSEINYWFDEDGKNGYYEMDINGQKISQEWHG